jgi:hypothetical protein
MSTPVPNTEHTQISAQLPASFKAGKEIVELIEDFLDGRFKNLRKGDYKLVDTINDISGSIALSAFSGNLTGPEEIIKSVKESIVSSINKFDRDFITRNKNVIGVDQKGDLTVDNFAKWVGSEHYKNILNNSEYSKLDPEMISMVYKATEKGSAKRGEISDLIYTKFFDVLDKHLDRSQQINQGRI